MSKRPEVAGQPASERLMQALDYRRFPEVPEISEEQVAIVLHALADHSAIVAAMNHPREWSTWQDRSVKDPAADVGRWLHAVADDLENEVLR